MIESLTPEVLANLIKESESECPIDYGMLSVDENSARLMIAFQLLEMYNAFPTKETKEVGMLVSLGHQILQNQILNLQIMQMVENMRQWTNLKPCPFCGLDLQFICDDVGSEDVLYSTGYDFDGARYHIVCNQAYGGCGTEMYGDTPDECVKKWNRRL